MTPAGTDAPSNQPPAPLGGGDDPHLAPSPAAGQPASALSSFVGGWARTSPAAGRPAPPEHAATDPWEDEDAPSAGSAEETEPPEEHVLEPADPRDFADDAEPDYSDEDFEEKPQPAAEDQGGLSRRGAPARRARRHPGRRTPARRAHRRAHTASPRRHRAAGRGRGPPGRGPHPAAPGVLYQPLHRP